MCGTVLYMTPKRKTEFVSVPLTHEARDRLRRAALTMSAAAGKRLSMSEAVIRMDDAYRAQEARRG